MEQSLSLYRIETEMAELGDLYREALEAGDVDAQIAVAKQLQVYVATEVQKVDNCAGFIRYAKDMAERIKAEENRLKTTREVWERVIDRVKQMVLSVMQETKQPRLQGKFSRFRIQNNSVDAVVIDDAAKIQDQYVRVTCTMSLKTWQELIATHERLCALVSRLGDPEISLSRIKAAIDAGTDVPGARLVRGEHLRTE